MWFRSDNRQNALMTRGGQSCGLLLMLLSMAAAFTGPRPLLGDGPVVRLERNLPDAGRLNVTGSKMAVPAHQISVAPVANEPRRTEVDLVVITPQRYRTTLKPWLAYRAAQGHRAILVSQWQSANHLRSILQRLNAEHPLRFVVLVGDVPASPAEDSHGEGTDVPTFFAQAKVNVRWGSEPEIATDHPYADLDGDHVPELAVGRLPVHHEQQLRDLLDKVMRYEQQESVGTWRHRVNLVAGVGGFGPVTDSVVEYAAKKLLTDGIPPEYQSKMAHSSWRSPYCPNPAEMRLATLGLHNEGCLFWVYMGHGHRHRLDRVRLPSGEDSPILEFADVNYMSSEEGMPIAILLACYAAAYDSPRDCLGESMLAQPRGPVAVIGGSRVTMPYAMAILGTGMMKGVFSERLATLGDVFVYAKQTLYAANGEIPSDQKLLDSLARAFSPTRDNLVGERIEHLQLFNLLGDPMLMIHQARPVGLRTSRQIIAGETLIVEGQTDIAGDCTVELVCRRDRLTFTPPTRAKYDGSVEVVREMHTTFQRANDPRWATRSLWVERGNFQTAIPVPAHAKGAAHLRVAVHGQQSVGLGSIEVVVQSPASAATASKPVLQKP